MQDFNEWIETREAGKGRRHHGDGGGPPEWLARLGGLLGVTLDVLHAAEKDGVHPTLLASIRNCVSWGIETMAQAVGESPEAMEAQLLASIAAAKGLATPEELANLSDMEAARLRATAFSEGARAAREHHEGATDTPPGEDA